MPGSGIAEVDDEGNPWAIASGMRNGKPVVLFVGSASAEGDVYGLKTATPTANALQPKFGGGLSDGYLVMLDLSATGSAPVTSPQEATRARMSATSRARTLNEKEISANPPEGTIFQFSPTYPKYVTADVEARSVSGAWWPSFLYGKPTGGTLEFKNGTLTGEATVLCDNWVQKSGEQTRRVLGELVPTNDEKTSVLQFTLTSLEAMTKRDVPAKNDKGKRTVEIGKAVGIVEFAGKKIPVRGECTVNYEKPRDGGATGIGIDVYFTCKGSEFGLQSVAKEEIDFRIGLRGTTESGPPPKSKK